MAPTPRPLSLKARALRWLSQREHSRTELRLKLLRAAQTRDAAGDRAAPGRGEAGSDAQGLADAASQVDALLDWLAANRYLSETRFVESRVHARAQRFGQRRIVQELAQHGVELDAEGARQLRATELERARAVWARKFGGQPAADAPARARQMRFLAARGFDADVIRRVLRGDVED